MKRFTALYVQLDQTTSTNAKVEAMVDYFAVASGADAAWAIWFLTGRRLKGLIKRAELRAWALAATGYPEWLLEETYQSVGDSAETIALLLPEPETDELDDASLAVWVEQRIKGLAKLDDAAKQETVCRWWRQMPTDARFVLNKLLTGALRVGVSQRLVIRALAAHFDLDTAVIAHRLMGNWQPDGELMEKIGDPDASNVDDSTPYPFYLASQLEGEVEALGETSDWQVEWKWDGIRAQLIRRSGQTFLWSRGEELLQGRFPEIEAAADSLDDGTVLDGEILGWADDAPLPFAQLQRRIGRLKPGPKLQKEVPISFIAYDLLEHEGADIRQTPIAARRSLLARTLNASASDSSILASEIVEATGWEALAALREESRARGVEGLMLKRKDSPYQVGRKRGAWWKWKIDPWTIDAVLLYAQPGSGRRSNLLTDYTFAVWNDEALVPVCKAYSGLDNTEIGELDRWIRRHTRERFGPVRSVEPKHVFEIAFEGIQHSSRHKSGVAFRFPRIARWRRDLGLKDADRLEDLKKLLDD